MCPHLPVSSGLPPPLLCVLLSVSFCPRLRVLLETEEQQLQQEMEEMKETSLEKQAKMRGRAKALREERERERRQLVSHKLEQQFR